MRGVVGLGVLILSILAIAVASWWSAPAGTYAVVAGPAGRAATPQPPGQLGDLSYLMDDAAPEWQFYPSLLPTSAKSTFVTVTGSYASADPTVKGIDVDAVFATEQADGVHRGVFSLAPQALVDLAVRAMHGEDFQHYPAGQAGAVLECGDYADQPLCFWADDSCLILVQYFAVPGDIAQLAATAPQLRDALIEG